MLSDYLLHLLYIWERLLSHPRSQINMVQNDPMVSMRAGRLRDIEEFVQGEDVVPALAVTE